MLESLTTGVIALDADGRLKTFNKAAEPDFGRFAGVFVGQQLASMARNRRSKPC